VNNTSTAVKWVADFRFGKCRQAYFFKGLRSFWQIGICQPIIGLLLFGKSEFANPLSDCFFFGKSEFANPFFVYIYYITK